jgi:type IV pilus assembly protein PilC
MRSMGVLISNNINVIKALNITLLSFEKNEYKAIIQYIIYRISSGSSISESMQAIKISHTYFFDEICIKSIEIAEKTARLSKAFEDISKYLEENLKTSKIMKNSMYYPITLFLVILIVIFFWVFFVIPTFAESFSDMGINISPATSSILSFKNFCESNGVLLTIGIALLIVMLIHNRKLIVSKIPIIRLMSRNIMMLKFFQCMNLMLMEKINFIDALMFSSGMSENKVFNQKIQNIILKIKSGYTISDSFSSSGIFTKQELVILSSGENANDIANTFRITSDMLSNKIKHTVDKASVMLTPIITILMGGLLLIVVCSVFMPIYDQLGECVQKL